MNKLLVTRWDGKIMTALLEEDRVRELSLEPEQKGLCVGDIYVAQVKNMAKNIDSAFVDLGNGQEGYLPLGKHSFLLKQREGKLCPGDAVLVQLEREGVKTKLPVVSGTLTFPGAGIVLMYPKKGISFSTKIQNSEWKKQAGAFLEPFLPQDTGLIVRTNGENIPLEILGEETEKKLDCLKKVLDVFPYRPCFSRLYRGMPAYINALMSHGAGIGTEQIITDDPALFEEMKIWDGQEGGFFEKKLRLYEDSLLPLRKLYGLETALSRALKEQVWLKSGGYLVIQPTEALTVIDVNTGKNTGHKKKEETIWLTNLEAAKEIAFQLRLRNLSGIIVADFIDMEEEEKKQKLLSYLAAQVKQDPVKTNVVDITRLNLVEITRKRIRKPLHEQIREL